MDRKPRIESSGLVLPARRELLTAGTLASAALAAGIPASVFAQTAAIRNVVAVTGACHVIERSKWERVGGMDESLAVVANDVDLCLRLSALGYYTVLQPHAIITHVGKASRGSDEPINDHVRFLARWPFLTELRDPCVPRPRRHLAT
mgnify:CR=1 FL=1